ncbi:hypothetical protein N7448_003286 [Penicillium atrosanguineum]|uniref:DUF4334 domain-containing protein n=1 Tax=Penicillium atrosanguineum TaxID=1132637 RepID=A0A9W9PW31_9EURO|nr:uncharacterized protein N7443_002256 [Penicillium atrosanguineum]KAJ5122154.1 hypothetical protein N7526_009091 [Penicillium atrosanguineum]KAJ5139878.1 hypothetical protein N7448_003286 [Penicillium atrosanguineum]KAJ5309795.1 hypothetical protein N7443_002256 [Penicillium atrosanguineum]KAJ5315315.1 hypothetical protein N7476_005622 [Penicillium atrosanguineum]
MTIQFPIIPFNFNHLPSSPAKKFAVLTQRPGVLSPANIDEVFRELKPITPQQLFGEWDGHALTTGHPFERELEELNWFGNTFEATEDVAPLIVAENGERIRFGDWGSASLYEIRYHGVVSAALVYDNRPVLVYYRAVRSNMVAGIMESKGFGSAGNFYFYLTK